MKRISGFALLALAALLPSGANAAVLNVVNVGAPAINCPFNTSCIVTVNDSIGNFTPPGDTGNARLQSRTYPGTAPAPMAGKLAYVYRLDMTQVTGTTCVNAIQFTFAALTPGPYAAGGTQDVWVTTSGGLGSVGLGSVTRVGGTGATVVNFAGNVCPGQTSYFFGLASSHTTPSMGTAKLFYTPAAAQGTTSIRVP